MRNRAAVLPFVVALALAVAAPAPAALVDLVATGTVVSKSADSLVVRTEDHGHRIAFVVDRSSVLPEGVAVGRRVRVVYHALGSTGQAADSVTLIGGDAAKAGR